MTMLNEVKLSDIARLLERNSFYSYNVFHNQSFYVSTSVLSDLPHGTRADFVTLLWALGGMNQGTLENAQVVVVSNDDDWRRDFALSHAHINGAHIVTVEHVLAIVTALLHPVAEK